MASDRIGRILSTFRKGEKDTGPAADITYCEGILGNAEDADGQVEGLIKASTRPSGSLTCDVLDRQIGEQSLCAARYVSYF